MVGGRMVGSIRSMTGDVMTSLMLSHYLVLGLNPIHFLVTLLTLFNLGLMIILLWLISELLELLSLLRQLRSIPLELQLSILREMSRSNPPQLYTSKATVATL